MRQATVMVIERERRMALRLERQLRELGYGVAGPLGSIEQALASVVQQPDLLLVDLRMAKGVSGRGGLRRLHDRSGAPVVFRAPRGHGCDIETELTALAYGYLVMPCSGQDVQAALQIALARRAGELRRESGEGRLRRLIDNVPVLLAYLDTNGRYQVANRLHEKWFGIPVDKMAGRSLLEVLGPHWFETLQAAFAEAGAGHSVSVEHPAGDPEDRHAQIYLAPDRTADGVRGIYLAACNVGNRVESERALRQERDRLRAVVDALGEGVIAFDAAGRIRYMNMLAQAVTGSSADEAHTLAPEEALRFVDPATGRRIDNPVRETLSTGQPAHLPPGAVLLSPDGREFTVQDTCSPLRDASGNTVGALLVLRNVTARDAVPGAASHDPLTGLLNRSQFEKALAARLASARLTGQPQALLHIDVDQLRDVNDEYGHHAGDALLRRLAELLRAKLRSSDLIARLGADEFAVLIDNCPTHRAQHMAQSVLDALHETGFSWQGRGVALSLSIGAATLDETTADGATALGAAQLACDLAKEAGGGRVGACPTEAGTLVPAGAETGDWAVRIADALAHDRFRLFAQRVAPVHDPHGHEQCAYEILVRLEGHNGTILPPMAFLPAAERCALMPQLDRWVIGHALRTLSSRLPVGGEHARYAINLSAASLTDEGLLAYISAQLQQTSLPPELLCFEVAEAAALAHLDRASALAEGLRALGCAFALDHFSSGVSAREYLQHLPVAYVKIDGSFVKGMLADQLDCAVVEGISRIGQALGIATVAEHAENADILTKLKEMGVTQAQGYVIHRPEPLQQALDTHADLLAAERALHASGNHWSAEWYLH